MVKKIIYTSHKGIDFTHHYQELLNASVVYNSISQFSKNYKQIQLLKIIAPDKIEIELYSAKDLTEGREANALWFFSHELVENQGFDIYLTKKGKLLKSA